MNEVEALLNGTINDSLINELTLKKYFKKAKLNNKELADHSDGLLLVLLFKNVK